MSSTPAPVAREAGGQRAARAMLVQEGGEIVAEVSRGDVRGDFAQNRGDIAMTRGQSCQCPISDTRDALSASAVARLLDDPIPPRVALPAILVRDDALRRRVRAEQAEDLIAADAEAVGGVRGNCERVAALEDDGLVLAALHPRLGRPVEDVEDLDVGMGVERGLVAGLRRLDARAHRRAARVVADDRLVLRQRPEAHALRVVEANDRRLFHAQTLRCRKSVTSGQARSA